MNISEEAVRNVAKLARLALTDGQIKRLVPELSEILGYAAQLQTVDLLNIAPTSHAYAVTNVLRKDVPRASLPRAEALANAPDTDGAQIRVPAVMEG